MPDLTRGVLAGYLAVVSALCVVIVGLLYRLFTSRVPALTTSIARNPVGTVQGEPLSFLALFGIFVAIVLLVVVIVVFGARYGPTDGNRSTRVADGERRDGTSGAERPPGADGE